MAAGPNRLTVVLHLLIGALIAGTVLGAAARLLMRLIAFEAGLPGFFSLGGSLEVVLFGVLVGAPLAAGFWLLRPRLRWRSPLPGLAFGVVLTLLLAALPPPSARSALAGTPDTPLLTWLGFGLLFTTWGAGLELVGAWILPPPRVGRAAGGHRSAGSTLGGPGTD
jgi:hypothetical protein